MAVIVCIGLLFLCFLSVTARLVLLHPVDVPKYGVVDLYKYFKYKKANLCRTGDIVAYTGLFGRGKTLSAVHKVVGLYNSYNGKKVWCPRRGRFVTQRVKVLSNVNLKIPYEQFVSLEQIYLCAEKNRAFDDENNTLTITVCLGDEFSVQLNSREFKKNINPLFLNTLLTCRHHHISLYYTAQRFGHVDALLRQVTSRVVECNKIWRFQLFKVYDAWDLENANDARNIAPLSRSGWLVRDRDYAAYDTLACVGNLKKSFDNGDMMSDDEILALQCNTASDMEAVGKPSRRFKRRAKKR